MSTAGRARRRWSHPKSLAAVLASGFAVANVLEPPTAPRGLPPHTAEFTHVEGAVYVRRARAHAWDPASSWTRLQECDLVRTSSSGRAEIALRDGTIIGLQQDSLLVIEDLPADGQERPSQPTTRCGVEVVFAH